MTNLLFVENMCLPFSPELEAKLIKRKPRFLHRHKMQRVFNEMNENIQRYKTDEYEELIKSGSSLIYFPLKQKCDNHWYEYLTS